MSDLQAALDAGAGPDSSSSTKMSFVPPPVYDSSPSNYSLRPPIPVLQPSPGRLSSSIPLPAAATASSSSRRSPTSSRSPSPSLFPQNSPAIEFIRETLYASLADVLERQPSLRKLVK